MITIREMVEGKRRRAIMAIEDVGGDEEGTKKELEDD